MVMEHVVRMLLATASVHREVRNVVKWDQVWYAVQPDGSVLVEDVY